jgi:hypothetical protein
MVEVMAHINLTYLQIKECYTNMQEHIMKNQWIFSQKKVTFCIFSKTLEINGYFSYVMKIWKFERILLFILNIFS